jgi:hypothetical protein
MKYLALLLCLLFLASSSISQTPTPAAASYGEDDPPPPATLAAGGPVTSPKAANRDPAYVRKDVPARITRFETPPVIDGQLNDPVWRQAAVFGDFVQTQPGDNAPPVSPVEVMMGYDAANLYVAFSVKQDRGTVRANVARRDNIFDDDYVGLYLDTFNDQRQAYVFFWNPLGIQADGTFTEGRGEDYSVDLVYQSKGVLTPDGFTVEAAIPFKSLRYLAGKNKQWGVHIFRRAKYSNNELDSWMPNDRSRSGSLPQAGHITGIENVETSRQIEIVPSVTLSESGRRTKFTFNNDPAGRYVNDGVKADLGVTAKIGLTPQVTLDFAYNPDFAQVEADAPVTSANQRFPIFFPEKRPFFLERIDIFQSPLNVVNTRSIVDPDIAAKLTGRRGKNTFGILYASDNAPGNYSKDERQDLGLCLRRQITDPSVVCPVSRFVDQNADIGVLRLKRDIGKENNLGIFATTYNFVDRHNNTGGLDGRFRLNKKTVADFQVLGTTSRRLFYDPDQDRFVYRTGNGLGYRGYLEVSGRNLYMNYLVEGRSRDYRADVGFVQRTDTNYAGSYIQYKTDPDPKKSVIYKRFYNETNIRYDWQGRSQYVFTNSQFQLALQKNTYVSVNGQLGYERVFEHEFGPRRSLTQQGAFFGPSGERSARFKANQVYFETQPNKQMFFSFFMDNTWGLMDYDLGAGHFPRASYAAVTFGQNAPLDPGPGHQIWTETHVRYQPTTALQTQLNWTRITIRRNDTGLVAFQDNIFSSRSTYQFSRDTFIRVRLDYSSLAREFRPQVVAGWTPNPGTALYIGYSDDLNYNGFNPYNGQYEPRFQGNGRTFFIKASYLFKRSF